MTRGGHRAGAGVKQGSKRGPYTKRAATKKRSQPSAATVNVLESFFRGNVAAASDGEAPSATAAVAAAEADSPLEAENGSV